MTKRSGILAIGNLLVDQTFRCNEYPKESMLTQISEIDTSCGGGCTNVLFDLAKIDPKINLELVGLVGNDKFGQFIIEEATKHHVDCSRVIQDDSQATSFTNVTINNKNGFRTFFHYMGGNQHFDVKYFDELNSSARIAHIAYLLLLPALEKADEQHVTASAKALASLQDQGFTISLDLVSAPEKERYLNWVVPALKYVDYLIINEEEASQLTGLPIGKGSSALDSYYAQAQKLLDQGVKQRVYIHFPNGAIVMTNNKEQAYTDAYHIPSQDVVSTLGAGDAFCAGVLYGIHENWPLKQTLRLGCASAHFNLYSMSATQGAASIERLQHFLDNYGY